MAQSERRRRSQVPKQDDNFVTWIFSDSDSESEEKDEKECDEETSEL